MHYAVQWRQTIVYKQCTSMCVPFLCSLITLGWLTDSGCFLGFRRAPALFHSGSVSGLTARLTGFSWVLIWRNGLRSLSVRSILWSRIEDGLCSRSILRGGGEQAPIPDLMPIGWAEGVAGLENVVLSIGSDVLVAAPSPIFWVPWETWEASWIFIYPTFLLIMHNHQPQPQVCTNSENNEH